MGLGQTTLGCHWRVGLAVVSPLFIVIQEAVIQCMK